MPENKGGEAPAGGGPKRGGLRLWRSSGGAGLGKDSSPIIPGQRSRDRIRRSWETRQARPGVGGRQAVPPGCHPQQPPLVPPTPRPGFGPLAKIPPHPLPRHLWVPRRGLPAGSPCWASSAVGSQGGRASEAVPEALGQRGGPSSSYPRAPPPNRKEARASPGRPCGVQEGAASSGRTPAGCGCSAERGGIKGSSAGAPPPRCSRQARGAGGQPKPRLVPARPGERFCFASSRAGRGAEGGAGRVSPPLGEGRGRSFLPWQSRLCR